VLSGEKAILEFRWDAENMTGMPRTAHETLSSNRPSQLWS
jgi:hypothetical protein